MGGFSAAHPSLRSSHPLPASLLPSSPHCPAPPVLRALPGAGRAAAGDGADEGCAPPPLCCAPCHRRPWRSAPAPNQPPPHTPTPARHPTPPRPRRRPVRRAAAPPRRLCLGPPGAQGAAGCRPRPQLPALVSRRVARADAQAPGSGCRRVRQGASEPARPPPAAPLRPCARSQRPPLVHRDLKSPNVLLSGAAGGVEGLAVNRAGRRVGGRACSTPRLLAFQCRRAHRRRGSLPPPRSPSRPSNSAARPSTHARGRQTGRGGCGQDRGRRHGAPHRRRGPRRPGHRRAAHDAAVGGAGGAAPGARGGQGGWVGADASGGGSGSVQAWVGAPRQPGSPAACLRLQSAARHPSQPCWPLPIHTPCPATLATCRPRRLTFGAMAW